MARRWLLGLCVPLVAAALTAPVTAQTVTRVELRSDVPVARAEEFLSWVTVERGQPLDEREVARSLRNLHAADVASQIEAYARPEPGGGLVVMFVLRGKTLIEEVAFRGSLGLDRRRLREAVTVGAGQPLLADRVFRSFYALQELYASEGYLDASVRLAIDEDEARRRARVVFEIEPGSPAMVTKVTFDGDLGGLEEGTLRGVLRLGEGQRYRRRGERDDRERLETWLLRQGYRTATVAPVGVEEVTSTEVHLAFTVEVGPKVVVEAPPDLRKRLSKRGVLPLSGFERYDESTAFESEKAIRTDCQIRGYYDCWVSVTESEEEGVITLAVAVEPGPKYTLTEVRFTGNESLSTQRLQGVMRVAERSLLSTDSGVLVDAWLREDLGSVRALYALEGYYQAAVQPPTIRREGRDLGLEIPVVEGPRRTVLDLEIRGVERLDRDDLLASLPLKAGGPYHPRRRDEALDTIRARYEAEGYNQAQVTAALDWSPDGTLATVRIDVLEGPRNLVERVIVRGRQETKAGVVRRVLDVDRGEPINQRRLLELQRRLYGLGVFSSVDVRLVPGTPYTGGRDIMVEVREGNSQRLTYGFGYDSEDGARGLVGYSHGNLFGRAVSGRVDLRASQREEQARALLRLPYLGRLRWPVTFSLFKNESDEESFRSQRRGAQAEIVRAGARSRWSLLGTYKIVEISDVDTGLEVLEIDRSLQEVEIASLTPSLFVDHRDDAVDPKRGWNATLLFEYAFPVLNADEEFGKVFLQTARYIPLGPAGATLAFNGRVGAIEPLGSGAEPDAICQEQGIDFPSCQIKISERFFAGGRTTHRAYRRDRLGVPGATLLPIDESLTAIGGTGLLLTNVDYRFPLGGGLGGTVFVDGGNIWADWRDISTSGMKWGGGVGVRYASPIGPVRLEIGWKFDRLESEDPYVVLFSFGNPF